MTFCQFGYGLRIRTNVAIPGLLDIGHCDTPDVELRCGVFPSWISDMLNGKAESYRISRRGDSPDARENRVGRIGNGSHFWFHYADDTQFIVSAGGDRIWATWRDPFTLDDAATYLLGPIFGFLLRLRGNVGIHASGVIGPGGALAFAGGAGTGKSTTAAWFVRHGHALVADDHLALDLRSEAVSVIRSYPRIRLWPESVEMLFDRPDALPLLTPNWDKRYLQIEDGFLDTTESLPLVAIYFLANRSPEARSQLVTPIAPSEAMIRLTANSHVNFLLTPQMRETDFRAMSRLARDIPCRIVHPSSDSLQLGALCEEMLSDASLISNNAVV